MRRVLEFFTPEESFRYEEWILRHQITALMVVSFFFSLGLFCFAWYRYFSGYQLVGLFQGFFSFFLMVGFFLLKYRKNIYLVYSALFLILFFIYFNVVFFNVPENRLNILWIATAPIYIFFFMNKQGGLVVFLLLMGFILYLISIDYGYTPEEYITLLANILITTFVMYMYDRFKDAEKRRLLQYNRVLEKKVQETTKEIRRLNRDLEKRVENEIEKRLTQEQILLRQHRMASMGEMIDSIAHQWRQPLMNINAVLMNIDRGIDKDRTPDYLKRKISEIFGITAYMSQTIEDFRSLLNEGKDRELFPVQECVGDILELMKNNLKRIEVTCRCEGDLKIYSYRSELVQVLTIIISNAIEALENRQSEKKRLWIETGKKEGKIIVEISDNGGGIEEAHLEKIFDPYFTTKEQSGGTGLGLYIAKIIVEHHMKGAIGVNNRAGGACFTVTIPIEVR